MKNQFDFQEEQREKHKKFGDNFAQEQQKAKEEFYKVKKKSKAKEK